MGGESPWEWWRLRVFDSRDGCRWPLSVVEVLELRGRGVVAGAVKTSVVPPVDPGKCRELDSVNRRRLP